MALMRHVRDQYEKPLSMPEGRKGRYLDHNLTSHVAPTSDEASEVGTSKHKPSVLFFSMPYFCLAPYTAYVPSNTSDFSPIKTLLQSWHISTPKQRDLQQAVCGLPYSTKGHVFHVPQIWCLMLSNSEPHSTLRYFDQRHSLLMGMIETLITCMTSQSTADKPQWNGIRVRSVSPEEDQPQLRVSDGGTRVWLLAVKSCTTWTVCIS